MWRWPVLAMVVVLGFGAGIGWSSAQQRGGSPAALTGQDYAEIHQLYSRYAQGTDFREGAMWLSVFTDDAVFQPGADAEEVVGQEALAEWRAQNFAARPPERQTRHWNSGWVITPAPGGAKGRLYYLRINVSSGRPVVGGVWALRRRLREDFRWMAHQGATRHTGHRDALGDRAMNDPCTIRGGLIAGSQTFEAA